MIESQSKKILLIYPNLKRPKIERFNERPDFDMRDTLIENFEDIFLKTAQAKEEFEIEKLVTKTDYSQNGLAINLLKNISWIENRCKYHFLENNFGFPVNENDTIEINDFNKNYRKYSEFELYKFYLQKTGYNIFKDNSELDYAKIFKILKFDITTAFVGGGGGKRHDCIYAIIKILELTHNTRLKFEKKLCQCTCSSVLYPDDHAKAWIEYMIENKLIIIENEPISFDD